MTTCLFADGLAELFAAVVVMLRRGPWATVEHTTTSVSAQQVNSVPLIQCCFLCRDFGGMERATTCKGSVDCPTLCDLITGWPRVQSVHTFKQDTEIVQKIVTAIVSSAVKPSQT